MKENTRLSVEEILSIPQLSFYIEPQNANLFTNKKTDSDLIRSKAFMAVGQSRLDAFNMSDEEYEKMVNSDIYVNKISMNALKKTYSENSSKISTGKLMLTLAGMAKDFLEQADKVEHGRSFLRTQLVMSNGNILSCFKPNAENDNGIVVAQTENGLESIDKAREELAQGILIANKYLSSTPEYKRLAISGKYTPTGDRPQERRMNLTVKDLEEYAKSPELLKLLSTEKIVEFSNKGLISKNAIYKLFSTGAMDKNIAVELMLDGVLPQEEVLKRVYKGTNINAIALDKSTSLRSKLMLYSAGKINIDLLERIAKKEKMPNDAKFAESFKGIGKYYEGNITKLAELLTHNVFDLQNTVKFLDVLESENAIDGEQRKYIGTIVADFKTNEFLNNSKNELIDSGNGRNSGILHYTPGLTIDPEERIKYLRSIGAVKKLKIRGEATLIKDESVEGSQTKKNSLDGYELFIIPDKKMAVLEKLYETTRDQGGNIVYKKNESGKLIPSLDNATYIMPIEMAKQFAETKNKKELISNPFVRKANHTMDWVLNVQDKMKSLSKVLSRNIEFDKENTKTWSDKIKENYLENKKKREIEFE